MFVIKTGGRYRVQARTFSPVDLGIPASRPRQYVIITHVKFNILLPFDGAAFEDIFFRTLQLSGSIFFSQIGGPMERQSYKRHLMHKRGLLLRNRSVRTATWADLLTAGNRIRLQGYIKLALQKYGEPKGIVDVLQQSSYSKSLPLVVPTLRRSGVVMDLSCMRPLLPSAHFDVMGIPAHRPEGCPHRCTLSSLLPTLSHAEMLKLTGNGMHLSAVGLCIIYVLACTQLCVEPST